MCIQRNNWCVHSKHLSWPGSLSHSSLHCLLRQILIRCVSSRDGVLAKDINNVQECCVLPEVLARRGHTAQLKGISLT